MINDQMQAWLNFSFLRVISFSIIGLQELIPVHPVISSLSGHQILDIHLLFLVFCLIPIASIGLSIHLPICLSIHPSDYSPVCQDILERVLGTIVYVTVIRILFENGRKWQFVQGSWLHLIILTPIRENCSVHQFQGSKQWQIFQGGCLWLCWLLFERNVVLISL